MCHASYIPVQVSDVYTRFVYTGVYLEFLPVRTTTHNLYGVQIENTDEVKTCMVYVFRI